MTTPSDKVTVFLRIKPTLDSKNQLSVQQLNDTTVLTLPPPTSKNSPIEFQFSHILDGKTTQEQVFDKAAHASIRQFLSGSDALLFAYGVTSSGKTYTIQGTETNRGLLPRTMEYILKSLRQQGSPLKLRISMLELYGRKISDLLFDEKSIAAHDKKTPDPTDLRFIFSGDKTQGYVQGQNFKTVTSFEQGMKFMDLGTSRRKVSSTALNSESSRSHCVYHLQLYDPSVPTGPDETSGCFANLSIIDLAGAERSQKTGGQGNAALQAETNQINFSLTVLQKLITGQDAPDYRSDNLAKIVSRYFEGNARVTIMCNINPAISEYDETVASLRWASKASKVKQTNNIQGTGATGAGNTKSQQQLMLENEYLKSQLQAMLAHQSQTPVPSPINSTSTSTSTSTSALATNNVLSKQFEQDLLQKFHSVTKAAKAKMEQDFCQFALQEFHQQHPQCLETWNANTGQNSSCDELNAHLERIVARNYHQQYHRQLTAMAQEIDQLKAELDDKDAELDTMNSELAEMDTKIEQIQNVGMKYYNGYVDLHKQFGLMKPILLNTIETHARSHEQILRCEEHFSQIQDSLPAIADKVLIPFIDAYGALISQYQNLQIEHSSLSQIHQEHIRQDAVAPAKTKKSTLSTITETPKPAGTRASSRLKKAATSESDGEETQFYTPITKKTSNKAIKSELFEIEEGDEEDRSNDDLFDDEEEVKPKKKLVKKLTTASTSTPVTRATRSTRSTAAPVSTIPSTPVARTARTRATAASLAGPTMRKSFEVNEEPPVVKKRALAKTQENKLNQEVTLPQSKTAAAASALPGPTTRKRKV